MESKLVETEPPDPPVVPSEVVPSTVWFGPVVPPNVARELVADLGAHHGVAVLHWPRDAGHVEQLARLGLPRLLLVSRDADAPAGCGPLQDWLRWPATNDEIHVRLLALYRRAAEEQSAGCPLGLKVAPAAGHTYVMRRCAGPVVKCAA